MLFLFSLILLRLRRSVLFPYTTLFRSRLVGQAIQPLVVVVPLAEGARRFEAGRAGVHRGERSRRDFQIALRKRSEEHTSELQSPCNLVCRLLLDKKKSIILLLHTYI